MLNNVVIQNKLEKKYPQMLGKIKVIENAIDTDDFIKNPSEKIVHILISNITLIMQLDVN